MVGKKQREKKSQGEIKKKKKAEKNAAISKRALEKIEEIKDIL